MKITVRSAAGIQEFALDSILRERRLISLEGPIDMETAQDFARQVLYFTQENDEEKIKVFINSPGGEIEAGMLIYDIIQSTSTPITIYCLGRAYSMAAVIFASGHFGRYILPHSKLMIHEPAVEAGLSGKTSSIQALSDDLTKSKKELDALLALHTGKKVSEIAELTKKDHFFTSQEAVDFGLADCVMSFADMIA